MLVELENKGCHLENPGVRITSETPEEAQRLTYIWNGHGAVVSWSRLPAGRIELCVASTPEMEDEQA